MKLGRLAVAAFAVSVGFGSSAEAGNGSNYIHMINGIDYFFGLGPYTGPPGLRGIWRCFPSELLHSPTRVTDPQSPEVGNYASKICAVHISITGTPGFLIVFPNITLSTSDGRCHFTQSGATALNFGIASVGTGAGFAVIGPLSDQGAPATISGAWAIANVGIVNPAATPATIVQLILNLVGLFSGGGGPSAVPVPDGESLTLWTAESNAQVGQGSRMYWTGSLDERNICSGYSFLLSGGAGPLTGFGFISAFEWSTGIGTVDATMSNVVSVGNSGGGPSGLNAHASTTAFAQPFDSGSGALTVSMSGTGPFGPTSSSGNILGFNSYDESNFFGGSPRLVITNLLSLTVDGSTQCPTSATANPARFELPGILAGTPLSGLGNQPRSTVAVTGLALTLLANPIWTAATIHSTVAGGSNIPWFPAAAGISGSTGNTGGFAIPVPVLASLVGVQLASASLGMNAGGTAIAPLANNGHSHSNSSVLTFFP